MEAFQRSLFLAFVSLLLVLSALFESLCVRHTQNSLPLTWHLRLVLHILLSPPFCSMLALIISMCHLENNCHPLIFHCQPPSVCIYHCLRSLVCRWMRDSLLLSGESKSVFVPLSTFNPLFSGRAKKIIPLPLFLFLFFYTHTSCCSKYKENLFCKCACVCMA